MDSAKMVHPPQAQGPGQSQTGQNACRHFRVSHEGFRFVSVIRVMPHDFDLVRSGCSFSTSCLGLDAPGIVQRQAGRGILNARFPVIPAWTLNARFPIIQRGCSSATRQTQKRSLEAKQVEGVSFGQFRPSLLSTPLVTFVPRDHGTCVKSGLPPEVLLSKDAGERWLTK